MKRSKRIVSLILTIAMMFSMSGVSVMAAENAENQENCIEISLEDAAAYSTGYYSKGLTVLNIATAGYSNACTVTSGSVPANAVITKVELRGTKSNGSGTVYWYITHNASGYTVRKLFASPATFYDFNGLTANSSWTIWIEGDPYSTVRNGTLKVYYSYN